MEYVVRQLEKPLRHHLERGKSILLLGPRQTGKSTLLSQFNADREISFIHTSIRQRYEKEPSFLSKEITAMDQKQPLVIVDEVQKVPQIMDEVQALIDEKKAQFILTGSSARKLRRGGVVNLLPGRLISLRLDPFTYKEQRTPLDDLLLDGSLPGIILNTNWQDREAELQSYVETYLEEEVRAEALVRQIGSFIRFLELASLESGKIMNFKGLSQEIGINHTTVASYFDILEDCLVAERIDPITKSTTRKKLTKSSRFLMFDLGVRRLAAAEGRKLGQTRMGELFEQYVGLELIRIARLASEKTQIRFWRDPNGPEVDWVIEKSRKWTPIEVKWTDKPREQDIKYIRLFLEEYKEASQGYLVCQTPHRVQLDKNIQAIPWQEIGVLFMTSLMET